MKKVFLTLFLSTSLVSFSQIKQESHNLFQAKEWSKDISLFRCKAFLFQDVLGVSTEVKKFNVEPLASAKSGELTTLIYKCEDLNKEGLILGFYGNYWNSQGVEFQGYGFKNLNKEKAVEFLNKIQNSIDENKEFLLREKDNNNIFFEYDDMQVIVYITSYSATIRVFWNGFDSTWENMAFIRSKRRFEKRI